MTCAAMLVENARSAALLLNYTMLGGTELIGVTTYAANNLNQYAATANPAEPFTYDFVGNFTSDGERSYA